MENFIDIENFIKENKCNPRKIEEYLILENILYYNYKILNTFYFQIFTTHVVLEYGFDFKYKTASIWAPIKYKNIKAFNEFYKYVNSIKYNIQTVTEK